MFKRKTNKFSAILVLLLIFYKAQSIFSSTYRKCQLFKTKAKNIGQLKQERVAIIEQDYYIQPVRETKKPLQYIYMDYFYHSYVGAGGSGQVFLVQDLQRNQQKIFKRFFKERNHQFQEENFIMHKLNYSVQWTRDYQILQNIQNYQSAQQSSEPQTQQEEAQMSYNEYIGQMVVKQPTIAIYPSRESYTLRDLSFDPQQARMIFYKLVRELKKTHSNGIIHNDLKMGNILLNSMGSNFKMFQTQLIDWNLASFYYLGYQSNMKKGTVCYYSPQLLFRSYHITPAIDVWSLGVVLFVYFTDRKPFFYKCKEDNLRAIVSLVGGQKIIQLIQKYGYNYQPTHMNLINQILQNPERFPPNSIRDAIPAQKNQFFTDELIHIFQRMLEPDPQLRITITELLASNYFKNLRKIPKMGYMKKMQQLKKNKKTQEQFKLQRQVARKTPENKQFAQGQKLSTIQGIRQKRQLENEPLMKKENDLVGQGEEVQSRKITQKGRNSQQKQVQKSQKDNKLL